MKILICLLALFSTGWSLGVLFSDDFQDGNADGWTEMSTGADYLVNAELWYQMSDQGSSASYAFSQRGDTGSTMSVEDYSVLALTRAYSPTGETGINLRYMEGPGTAYAFYLDYQEDNCYICRYDDFSSSQQLGSAVSYPGGLDYGISYWIRFECVGEVLRAKVWIGESGQEPSVWLIARSDGTYIDNGCMALESSNPYGNDYHAEFDSVMVTSFPSLFESSTWAAIKSCF